MKKKKYLLPTTNGSKSNNTNNTGVYNISTSVENPSVNIGFVVPGTQTHIVECSQDYTTTALFTTTDATQDDVAPKLEKTPEEDLKDGEERSEETSSMATPPCSTVKATDNLVIPDIKILNYSYHIPEQTPFELKEPVEVTQTHLSPTPDLDPFFTNKTDAIGPVV